MTVAFHHLLWQTYRFSLQLLPFTAIFANLNVHSK